MAFVSFYILRGLMQVSYTLISKINIESIFDEIPWWLSLGLPRNIFDNSAIWKNKWFLFLWPYRLLHHLSLRVQGPRLVQVCLVQCTHLSILGSVNGIFERSLCDRFDNGNNIRSLHLAYRREIFIFNRR